jgi:DNA polymerase I-like protein with 3'-5' exonuclease and polymerase domains
MALIRRITIEPTASVPARVQPVANTPLVRRGNPDAPIVVVCEPNSRKGFDGGFPCDPQSLNLFAQAALKYGLQRDDFQFLSLCPPISDVDADSASRKWKFVEAHSGQVLDAIARSDAKCVITQGELASRLVLGRAVKITKSRGNAEVRTFGEKPRLVVPVLSPAFVNRFPEHKPTFESDILTLTKLKMSNWAMPKTEHSYEWREDISDILRDPPRLITFDTETTGLRWWDPAVRVLTAQFAYEPGHAIAVPLHAGYWPYLTARQFGRLRGQLRELLSNPKVMKAGHNIKFDDRMMAKEGINVEGWVHDTQLMAFAIDENMMSFSLDDCVRRWVPTMAGYCVTPNTSLLSADMKHVTAGLVKVGDELLGFDEHVQSPRERRKMRVAKVVKVTRLLKPCLTFTMRSGRKLTVSTDHKMLTKNMRGGNWGWRRADSFRVGQTFKPFPWQEAGRSYDDGYMAGILDGEGHVTNGGVTGMRLGYAQVDGAVWDNAHRIVSRDGFVFSHNVSKKDSPKPVNNASCHSWTALEVLQRYQPRRLIGKRKWIGKAIPSKSSDPIVSIEDAGVCEVVGIETDCHTFIAEGFCSHNSDEFDANTDKSRMIEVAYDEMLEYGGGDVDADLQLLLTLDRALDADPRQRNCYERMMMNGIMAFARNIEQFGILIDKDHLRTFGVEVKEFLSMRYRELIQQVPAAVRLKHMDKGLEFSRPEFIKDLLFSKEGFGLKPIVFTKSTRNLPDAQKVASTSTKDHLPYFTDIEGPVGEFVTNLVDYQKIDKLSGTYIGEEEKGSGFWQYIAPDGRIYPSYMLHRTVTGRCIPLSTRVLTNFGSMSMAEIRDYKATRRSALLVLTHKNRFRKVTDFVSNGWRPTFRISAGGYSVEATGNHPFLTPTGWVNLEDLRVGDETFTYAFDFEREVEEEWRPTAEDMRYEVSSLGRVRGPRGLLSQVPKGEWGHTRVSLGRDNKDIPVHRIVCAAFHGTCPEGFECLHENGIPADNRASNLRWGTSAENGEQMIAHGRSRRGERSNQCVIPDADISVIKAARAAGDFYQTIADRYGVTESLIRSICHGRRRKESISPFVVSRITAIESTGISETFDISVEDDHSFIAENFAVHNTASADPNGQNFPKRGRLAKSYLKIFQATPGFKIVSADLSQIELRIAAWMAMDKVMLSLYRSGGDIHTATAKYVSQLSDAQWDALPKAMRKLKRTQAKAVNFGFLYGMGWKKFMGYAKTDYGVTYTEKEAQEARERFFNLYTGLPAWHERMRDFAREHGYVRALHGAVRHLPSIKSNDKMIRSSAERQAINSPVQRLGSDLGMMAVIRFAMQADPELFRVIGFVHDAVLVEARDGYEQECMSALVWAMENQPMQEWFGINAPLPIKAEADIGINFGETLEMGELPPVEERPEWFRAMSFDSFEAARPEWWRDSKEEEAKNQFHIVQRLEDVGL